MSLLNSTNHLTGTLRRIWRYAGTPATGTTLAGVADKGDLCIDTTNAKLYQNTNTKASPTWTERASGTGALLATNASEMAANGTSTANTLGDSAAAAPINHVHKLGTHDHSDDTKGGATLGAVTITSITLSGDIDMSGQASGTYDFTLKNDAADALSIKDSAGDLVVFKTSIGAQTVTITPATTITGALTASAGIGVTTGGIEVTAGGVTITAGGIEVVAGGATVTAGGLTVAADGITVTGDSTITGGLTVTGSLTWGGATTIGESLTVDELILDTDGVALAGTVCGLWRDNAGDASLQAVTGKEIKFLIASTVEMQIGGTETIINEGSGDRNFRVESANLAYALYVDGGKDCVVVGDNTDISDVDYRLMVGNVAKTLADNESAAILYVAPTAATTESGTGATTHGYIATAYFKEPNITHGGTSAITVAATVYIADAPTEGTANHALYIASGSAYMAGALTVAGAVELDGGAFVFNNTSADLDFRVESNGLQYALYVDGGKDCVVIGDNTDISDIDYRCMIGNVAKTLEQDQSAAILYVAPTASTTENAAGTHTYIATAYFAEPNITGAGAATTVAATVYIADAPTEASANYALYIASGAMYSAGAITINSGNLVLTSGNLDVSAAASDIVFKAATAAALELSDGTTKFYAIDSRVTTAGVISHAFDISDYTIASGATNVATGLSLAAHTLTYTSNTQVTTQVDTVVLGARTIAGDGAPGAVTVDEANTLLAVAPTEGANAVLTAASAIRVVNGGGTPVNQYGLYIEDLTVGATLDVGIYIAGADSAAIYVAADPIQVADSVVIGFGTGTGVGAYDASILYNGTNLVINPKNIGAGVIALGSGEGGATAGSGTTLRAVDVATGGAGNVNGADLTIAAGLGTGTGTRGLVIIQTPQVAGAGDNPQTLETLATFGEDGVTFKAGTVIQSAAAGEIAFSVTNDALTIGTEGSIVIPYISQTDPGFSDAIGGNVDGCIGINYDSDTGPTATLEARVNGGWLSVAVSGIEIQGKTVGGGKKHAEKWHANQLLGADRVDETICAICGKKMKPGEKLSLYANYERTTPDGTKNLHAIFCHADCS